MKLESLRHHLPWLIIVALPFAFYWKMFHPSQADRLILRGDFLNQHYVWKSYALNRVKQGELPLWNPHVLGGVPFHANPQIGIFYPPTYLLLPFTRDGRVSYRALEAYQLLHLVLAGIGMFMLARALGLERISSLTAALIVMFTGFFTTPGHHALVLTAGWIPLTLLMVKRCADAPGTWRVSQLGIVLALAILAGHPQIAYYAVLLSCAFSLWLMGVARSVRSTLPALGLAILLSAVQWLPTLRLSGESNRAQTGYEYATTFGLSPYFLGASIVPRGQIVLPGQDAAAPLHLYVGIATLGLAFMGLTMSRRRERWFFGGLSVLALLLSLGQASLVFDAFYLLVPGFGKFRIPYRLLGLYSLGMAGLAAMGMEVWCRPAPSTRRRLRSITSGWWILAGALLVWSALSRSQVTRAQLAPSDVERILGATSWAVFLVVATGTIFTIRIWQPRFRSAHVLLLLLVVDLSSFTRGRGQHPAATLVRAGERDVHRLARSQPELARHVSNSNLESYSMLYGTHFVGGQDSLIDGRYLELLEASEESSNVMSLLNARYVGRTDDPSEFPWCGQRYRSVLPLIEVTTELSPVRLVSDDALPFTSLAVHWTPLAPEAGATVLINGQAHGLIGPSPLNIRLPSPSRLETVELNVPAGSAGVRIDDIELDLNPIGLKADYLRWGAIRLNLHALPRAYVAESRPDGRVTSPEDAVSDAGLECWSVHRPVEIDSHEAHDARTPAFFRRDSAEITSYRPEEVVMNISARREGFVVLADTYHPGWSASVDSEPRPILRAFGAFRAIPIEAGEQVVRLVYRPASLYWGAALTLAGLALILTGCVASTLLRRRRDEPPEDVPGN